MLIVEIHAFKLFFLGALNNKNNRFSLVVRPPKRSEVQQPGEFLPRVLLRLSFWKGAQCRALSGPPLVPLFIEGVIRNSLVGTKEGLFLLSRLQFDDVLTEKLS